MVVFLGGVGVEGDNVAFCQQGLQGHIFSDLLYLLVGVQVVGQQAAAKAGQMLQHRLANAAGANNAYGAAGNIPADLALQGVVLHFSTLQDMASLPQAHQHQHNSKVCHAVGRIVHVGHLHAQLPGLFQVHMVVADGTAADGLDPQVVEPLDHRCAHVAGGQGNSVVPCRQLGIFQGGIGLGVAVFHAPLLGQVLDDGLLIKGTQGVEKNFGTHIFLLRFLCSGFFILPHCSTFFAEEQRFLHEFCSRLL